MGKEYVPIYFDWLEVTQDLSPEEKGNLIDAVVSYASGAEYEQLLTGGCKIAFRFFKGQVDRNAAISDARSKAGSNKGKQAESNANKTEQTTTKSQKEKEKEKDKDKNKETDILFDRFWKAYPRKVNKPGAQKAFAKLNPDEELLKTMLTAIDKQKGSAQWQENNGQFIPHPATWLNGRRWEDDLPRIQVKVAPVADFEQRDYSGVKVEMEEQLAREMEEFRRGAG